MEEITEITREGITRLHADADALQTEVIAVAENLLEKVLSQADEIRRQLQDP